MLLNLKGTPEDTHKYNIISCKGLRNEIASAVLALMKDPIRACSDNKITRASEYTDIHIFDVITPTFSGLISAEMAANKGSNVNIRKYLYVDKNKKRFVVFSVLENVIDVEKNVLCKSRMSIQNEFQLQFFLEFANPTSRFL